MYAIHLDGLWQYLPAAPDDDTNYALENANGWDTMPIPQNWFLAGLDHYGVVWFRRSFEMPPNEECSVWWLEFSGVDYHADVWINGMHVGSHTGYFSKFRFDVTHVIAMGENEIVVRVDCPEDHPTRQRLVKGVLSRRDLTWFQPWQPEAVCTGGIWGSVMLQPYDCANPPDGDDWYAPLAKPVVRSDPETMKWQRGDAPFFPRGAVYFPARCLSQLTREDFEQDIALMKAANLNMVRVYGHVLPDVFYEVCDEMGMLVWQDFPLYGAYSDTFEFHTEALRQLEAMIHQLGHHLCIAVWGIHADPPWMVKSGNIQNRKLDQKLAKRARELDSVRYIHLDRAQKKGQTTYFADGLQIQNAEQPMPLVYGRKSAPNLETVREVMQDDMVTLPLHLDGLLPGDSLEAQVATSQRLHAETIQFPVEHCRARKGEGTTGIFYHMFVDPELGVSSSVVDSRRRPKAAFATLRTCMQPMLPIALLSVPDIPLLPSQEPLTLGVMVVNDLPERFVDWTCKVSLTGWIPGSETTTGDTYMHHWAHVYKNLVIEPCAKTMLGQVTIPPLPEMTLEYHLVLQLFDLDDELGRAVVNAYVLNVVIE